MNDTVDVLPPNTSTPCVRRSALYGHNLVGQKTLKIKVHDGLGERAMSISSSDQHLDILERTAQMMKRPNHAVEIGYEAPWSSKTGTKKNLAYISNDDELDEFWLAYSRYVKVQQKKRQNRGQEIVCEIIFRNMFDNPQV
jgi:hypothetical protein